MFRKIFKKLIPKNTLSLQNVSKNDRFVETLHGKSNTIDPIILTVVKTIPDVNGCVTSSNKGQVRVTYMKDLTKNYTFQKNQENIGE